MATVKQLSRINLSTNNTNKVVCGYCHENCTKYIPFDIIYLCVVYCFVADEFDPSNTCKNLLIEGTNNNICKCINNNTYGSTFGVSIISSSHIKYHHWKFKVIIDRKRKKDESTKEKDRKYKLVIGIIQNSECKQLKKDRLFTEATSYGCIIDDHYNTTHGIETSDGWEFDVINLETIDIDMYLDFIDKKLTLWCFGTTQTYREFSGDSIGNIVDNVEYRMAITLSDIDTSVILLSYYGSSIWNKSNNGNFQSHIDYAQSINSTQKVFHFERAIEIAPSDYSFSEDYISSLMDVSQYNKAYEYILKTNKGTAIQIEMISSQLLEAKLEINDSQRFEFSGELTGHCDEIKCIKTIPNGSDEILVLCSNDNSIIICDVKGNKIIKKLNAICFDVSWDGQYIVAAINNGDTLTLFYMKTGEVTRKFMSKQDMITLCKFSPNNERVVGCSKNNMIYLWNVGNGQLIQEINSAHNDLILCIDFSPVIDDNIFISSGCDKKIKTWQIMDDNKCIINLLNENEHNYKYPEAITAISISPDGSLLVSADKNGFISLWDINANTLISTLYAKTSYRFHSFFEDEYVDKNGICDCPINDIKFNPKRYWLCVAITDCIEIWDLETKVIVVVIKNDNYNKLIKCKCISWSYDGDILYAGYSDNSIKIWKLIESKDKTKEIAIT